MARDKTGQYWDDTLNMARHIDCHCETGDKCWWKQMHKRFKQPLGWFPEQADKISILERSKPKVYALQWLGDIAFLPQEQVIKIFDTVTMKNNSRTFLYTKPHKYLVLTKWPELLYEKLIERELFGWEKNWKNIPPFMVRLLKLVFTNYHLILLQQHTF